MRFLLLVVSLFLILTGCSHTIRPGLHPLDLPEQSKAEIVKYENIKINTKNKYKRFFVYETKTPGRADSIRAFGAKDFCYDPQNRNFVVPLKGDYDFDNEPSDGLFVAIPRDSVTLCKKGIRDTTYWARHHALRGLIYGTLIGGVITGYFFGGLLSIAAAEDTGIIMASMFGIGAAIGGPLGSLFVTVKHGQPTEDTQERCSQYYTDKELEVYLNRNLCYYSPKPTSKGYSIIHVGDEKIKPYEDDYFWGVENESKMPEYTPEGYRIIRINTGENKPYRNNVVTPPIRPTPPPTQRGSVWDNY